MTLSENFKHQQIPLEISIQDVYSSYGRLKVLRGVSFEVRRGDIAGIIGVSGSGKTTLLRLITGQITPDQGTVYVADLEVKKNREQISYITGYVPQHDYLSLYMEFSPLTNAKYFGRQYQLSNQVIEERAREILSILNFTEELMKKPVQNLSGGERKRASIAVGMINRPRVLLLDEPTTGLDAHLRHEVLNFLKQLNHTYNTTMIIISHDLEIVDYCNHVMILEEGRVNKAGNPHMLITELPGNGTGIQLEFDLITTELLKRLERLPDVDHIIRRGRNSINIFVQKPREHFSLYLKTLNKWKITPRQISLIKTDFMDFFRVKPWKTEQNDLGL